MQAIYVRSYRCTYRYYESINIEQQMCIHLRTNETYTEMAHNFVQQWLHIDSKVLGS